jgi:type IV pilus biogenesis protein CpaD/CtpE
MRQIKASLFLAGLLLLTGCNQTLDVSMPSRMKTGQIQLKDVMKTATLNPLVVDADAVNIIAGDYERNGDGPVRLVVPYAPGNPLNRVAAEAQGTRYHDAFGKYGIPVLVSYAANGDRGAQAVVSYMALAAEPPRNCAPMPEYLGATTNEAGRTDFGCETRTVQSKMISRPSDLAGTAGTPDDDGKRHGNITDRYRNGAPNPTLTGLSTGG